MELFWWFCVIALFAVGLLGTVLPFIPGTTVILAGAITHRIMLGGDKSIGWKCIVILVFLTFLSYVFDFLGGYFGAKYFGASRWGTLGAVIGAIVGFFFGLLGLFLGPVIGALAGEFISGKRVVDAGRAGWGSFLGNMAGMIGKLGIGLVMVVIFLMSVPSPF
jgi:uncharacterized protein YqgC (DUF456 family)